MKRAVVSLLGLVFVAGCPEDAKNKEDAKALAADKAALECEQIFSKTSCETCLLYTSFTRRRGTDELWGFCSGCYYADTCKAGCTWTGHVLFGRRGNNPMCHHRALELLRVGRRERLVPRTAAPNEPFDHATFELVEEPWPAQALLRAHALVDSGEGWLDEP